MPFLDNEDKKILKIIVIFVSIALLTGTIAFYITQPKPNAPKHTLNNIKITHIDKVSAITTFTNDNNDTINYHYIPSGYIPTIYINHKKYILSRTENKQIKKLAYAKYPLSVDCLRSDKDILPGTNTEITKQFVDYLIKHDIYSDITFKGYSPTTKQLTYAVDYNDEPITITLSNNGFYNATNKNDNCINTDTLQKNITTMIISGVLLLFIFIVIAVISNLCDDPLDINKRSPAKHKPSSTICSPGSKKLNKKGNRK